jgi:hypothetical protein
MRKIAAAVLWILCFGAFAFGQEGAKEFRVPNSEISASFAYEHAGLAGSSAPTHGAVRQGSANLHDFAFGFSHYFYGRAGFTAEIAHVSNSAIDPTGISYVRTSFLAGPTVRLHRYGFFSPSVHVLGGVDRATFTVPNVGSTFTFQNTDFAIAGGGTVDGNLSPRLAVRLAQVDYLYTHHYGTGQSSFRYLAGLVFRF